MTKKNKAAYFLVIMILTSCTHYSTTQQNIKKVNAAFALKKDKGLIPSPTPTQKNSPDQNNAIPLSQFLDAKTPTTTQSINPWFSRLQDWSRVYLEIAKAEREVRNYTLSAKYSLLAVMWSDRALQIRDLPTSGAVFKVKLWLDQLPWPELPATSAYYSAQDVYAKIFITRNILKDFRNRFCLISQGIPIIQTLAYLDLSIDLYRQKKYAKALYKIQNGLSSVENISPEEDKKCELSEEETAAVNSK